MATEGHTPADDDEVDIPEYTQDEMGISDTREEIQELLNDMELELYEEWRMELARWLFYMGKKPHFYEGYSKNSMYGIINAVEKFTEWVMREKEFTMDFSPDLLDEYWNRVLLPNDNQLDSNRRQMNHVALIAKYRGEEYSIPNSEEVYEEINRRSSNGFTDFFSPRELEAVRTAALRAYAIPDPDDLDADERDEWASKLAQRLGTPKHKLSDEDWEDEASYKIPSLVWASRDVGFRPNEVKDSRMSWLRLDDDADARFQIPKDEDTKDGSNDWRCYLSPESARLLRKWKEQRTELDRYDGEEAIWLNREGNPFNSKSLRGIMMNLMDEAGIDQTDREQGWYMIRRGVGTEIANSQGLSAVMSQLRISNIDTARRYVQTDEPSIREWMDSR